MGEVSTADRHLATVTTIYHLKVTRLDEWVRDAREGRIHLGRRLTLTTGKAALSIHREGFELGRDYERAHRSKAR